MPQLEIYFVGLMCFITEQGKYTHVRVLWDEDLEHVPFLYLGPTASNFTKAIPLRGTVSFGLPSGGPSTDTAPDSPLIHLPSTISGAPQLHPNPPLAARINLPNGSIFGISLKIDEAKIQLGSTVKIQAVSQIALVSAAAGPNGVDVLVDGTVIDTVSPTSYVLIGNMSRQHDPKKNNHFTKYIRLTQGGSGIATVTLNDPENAQTVPGGYQGNNFAEVSDFILEKFPDTKTVGAPDCTITQWP